MVSDDSLKKRAVEIEKLVFLVQNGDQEAFSKLYDIFIDPVYKYVFYRVKDGDAEDIVENVFLRVWENIRKYQLKKNMFSAWIFRIAHNLVVDYYRSVKDKAYEELDPQTPEHRREHNPIRNTENSLDQKILKMALAKIKKQYQDIILYKFVNELSNKEISDILGKSEGSLRILQFRALKALKRELEDVGAKYEF